MLIGDWFGYCFFEGCGKMRNFVVDRVGEWKQNGICVCLMTVHLLINIIVYIIQLFTYD